MKSAEATAEVFVTAFESLPRPQRAAVLRRLLDSPKLREDLLDVSRWLQRRKERAVPYRQVREELRRKRRL